MERVRKPKVNGRPKIRVLVIEDEPAILRFLKPALEANEHLDLCWRDQITDLAEIFDDAVYGTSIWAIGLNRVALIRAELLSLTQSQCTA
jgi:hypothetical protein